MSDVADTIRGELRREARRRRSRLILTLSMYSALLLVFVLRPHGVQLPITLTLYAVLSLLLAGVWAVLTLQPAREVPEWVGGILILAAVGSPLVEALLTGGPDPMIWQWRCVRSILLSSTGAWLLGRITLGQLAPRFGGAPRAFLAVGLMIGAAATGVSCPLTGLLHLLASHAAPLLVLAGAAVVVARMRSRA